MSKREYVIVLIRMQYSGNPNIFDANSPIPINNLYQYFLKAEDWYLYYTVISLTSIKDPKPYTQLPLGQVWNALSRTQT